MPNKPFEWIGRHQLSASPAQTPCLPLKGSVGLSECRKGLQPIQERFKTCKQDLAQADYL
jgi:hypothetical protein